MSLARIGVASLVAAVAAACGGAASTPTAPAAAPVSAAAVKSLHVDGPAIVVGDRKPFTATATFVDGTQQNVSPQASWSSSDPTVATVDATGMVTGVSEGNVDIHASFRGAADSIYRNVTPLLFFKAGGTVCRVAPPCGKNGGVAYWVCPGPFC